MIALFLKKIGHYAFVEISLKGIFNKWSFCLVQLKAKLSYGRFLSIQSYYWELFPNTHLKVSDALVYPAIASYSPRKSF